MRFHLAIGLVLASASYVFAARHHPRDCLPAATPSLTTNTASPPETITTYPDSCTYRPTQTFYSSSGCGHTCETGFCIIDAPATVSCGCPTVFIETQTTTVCPTQAPCRQCYTGWGTFLYTEQCASTTATGLAKVSQTPK